MGWEIAALWRKSGQRPGHYFRSFLYRKHVENPFGFLSFKDRNTLWRCFRRVESEPILTSKVLFHQHFNGIVGIRLPRHLGNTGSGLFYAMDGTEHSLATETDLENVLSHLLGEVRIGGGSSVFAKTSTGALGEGAFKLSSLSQAPALWKAMQDKVYVFQQTVSQHSAIAAVMPDTLNTLRITTLRRGNGEPVLASAWLKIGRKGSVADNVPGMLIIGVDLASGRLARCAWSKFEEGADTFTHHPDTGHLLSGFQIPEYEAAADMALMAARHIEYPVVGWDVGIGVEGPVLLEGNSGSNYMSDEIAHGVGYLDHPVLGPFLREVLAAEKAARTS